MKNLIFFLFISPFLLFTQVAQSGQIEEIVIEVTSQDVDRHKISKEASLEASQKFVQEFLGVKKYKALQNKIKKNILSNQNRFILYVKTGKSIKQEAVKKSLTSLNFIKKKSNKAESNLEYLTKVTVGLSKKNLQDLLVQHHLFYDSLATSCVLPVVVFATNFKEKKTHAWWRDNLPHQEKSFSKIIASYFYSQLNKKLIENSFYSIDPMFAQLYSTLPKSLLPRRNNSKYFIRMSKFLNCQLMLSGDIDISQNQNTDRYLIEILLTAFNVETKQKLFDFSKKINLDTIHSGNFLSTQSQLKKEVYSKLEDVFNSITFQLSFYKDKGSLDLHRTMISIQGPLNFYEKEQLKRYLIQNIPSIKDLQEKLLASNKVVYESEISGTIFNVANDLKKHHSKRFHWQVVGQSKKQLNIYVKKR